MALDARTTLTAAASLTSVTTVLLVLYRSTRRTYPGFDRWTGASGLVALGFTLLACRGLIPDWLSIVAANTAITTASVVRLWGTREFLGQPPMRRWWWGLPPLVAAALPVLLYGFDTYRGRTAVVLVAIAAPALATAVSFLRAAAGEERLLQRATAALLLLLVAAMALRVAATPALPPSLLSSDHAQTAFLLASALLEAAWNVMFLILNGSRLERELRRALDDVKTLSGLLPICSWCKKVRDDQGYWRQIEQFVSERSDARFSHGICPDCRDRVRAEALLG